VAALLAGGVALRNISGSEYHQNESQWLVAKWLLRMASS